MICDGLGLMWYMDLKFIGISSHFLQTVRKSLAVGSNFMVLMGKMITSEPALCGYLSSHQRSLNITQTKFIEQAGGPAGSYLLSIVIDFLSTNSIPDCLKASFLFVFLVF